MPYYHLTLTQGRADTITSIEADSKTDLLNLFTSVSTATVTNIKKIVYSKDLNINYSKTTFFPVGFYKQVNVLATNGKEAKVFELNHVKKTITSKKILETFKRNVLINGKKVTDIYSIVYK